MFKAATLLLSCEKATFLISKRQHEKLPFRSKMRLGFHLLICTACQKFTKQMDYLSTNLQHLQQEVESGKPVFKLPEDVKLNLQKKIDDSINTQH